MKTAVFEIRMVKGFCGFCSFLIENHKLFLTTGMLGGLSTLSALSMETVEMFQGGRYLSASGNVVLNVGLSILGVVIGMWIADMVYAK